MATDSTKDAIPLQSRENPLPHHLSRRRERGAIASQRPAPVFGARMASALLGPVVLERWRRAAYKIALGLDNEQNGQSLALGQCITFRPKDH